MKAAAHLQNTVLLLLILTLFDGCGIYSFTGASIDYSKIKTINIHYFPNRAEIIIPTLAQQLTDALIDKFRSQTKLRLVNGTADVALEGEITGYNTVSAAIQGNDKPAQNRLTITIRVKFTNNVKPEESFDQSFSRFETYGSAQSITTVESQLILTILDQLTEDIFNKAFVNW
jgi:Lipopolysaccharide-assembly